MLKGNLSSRPFYNDRMVTVAIAVCALLVLGATVINASRLVTLMTERTAVRTRLNADLAEAGRVRMAANALQSRIDRATLAQLAEAAREANELIDQRAFSWTALLGQLERTLPPDVRLTSIAPRAQRGVFQVSMAVIARDLNDIEAFVDALLDAGGFYDVAPVEQRANDDGTYQAVVQASYLSARALASQAQQASTSGAVQP